MRRSETGASLVEYAGLIVLAGLILGALVAIGIPGKVEAACSSALCRILGEKNCPLAPPAGPQPTARPSTGPTRAPGKNGWQYADQMPPRAPIPRPDCAKDAKLPWSEGLHAHNDYQNEHPLQDALDNGATSVEADVFLDDDGDLVVGHDPNAGPRGSLEDLYVEPLRERAAKNGGQIYPGRTAPFQLTIEIKQKGNEDAYRAVLDEAKKLPSNVQVVLSGGRPDEDKIMKPPLGPMPDNVTMDYIPDYHSGSGCTLPTELDPGTPEHPNPAYRQDLAKKVTVINGEWAKGKCGDTDGDGLISGQEQSDLDAFVAKAHAAGYRTRFWGGPDGRYRFPFGKENGHFLPCSPWHGGKCSDGQRNDAWHAMQHAGADTLGTNHLGTGKNFIHSCGKEF